MFSQLKVKYKSLGSVLLPRGTTAFVYVGLKFLNAYEGEGRLFGGCLEVLEFLKGTEYWPELEFWNDKILFLETSEDKPNVTQVKYALRNYGWMGVLNKVKGIVYGRAREYTDEEKEELYKLLLQIQDEFELKIPIVANADIGHTDPQWIIPYGDRIRISNKSIERTIFK